MALEKTTISIPFVGGLDTKTDLKLVDAGALTDAKNGIYTKNKTIIKRNGYDALPTDIISGGNITQGNRLAEYKDELPLLTANKLYSFSDNTDKWVEKGLTSHVEVKSRAVTASDGSGYAQLLPDSAINSNVKVLAWIQQSFLFASVIDETTNTEYLSNVQLYGPIVSVGPSCRAVSIGAYLFVFWATAGAIHYRKIDPLNPTAFAADTIIVAANAYDVLASWDVISYGANGVLSWWDTVANTIETRVIDDTGAILQTSSIANPITPFIYGITLCYDSSNNNVYVTITDQVTVTYAVLSPVLAIVLAFTIIDVTGVAAPTQSVSTIIESAGVMRVFWDYFNIYAATPTNPLNDFQVNTATATVLGVVTAGTNPLNRELKIQSRPFIYSGETYIMCNTKSVLQCTYYLMNKTGQMIAKSNFNKGTPSNTTTRIVNVISLGSGLFKIFSPITTKLIQSGLTFIVSNISEMSFDFGSINPQRSKEVNNVLMIAGGYPRLYDGNDVTEYGFNLFPENIVTTVVGAGGVLTPGQYAYYVVYEWTDAKGNYHQSSPSTGNIVTVVAVNSLVTLDIPTLRITDKENAKIAIYRTQVNGTVAYRLEWTGGVAGSNPRNNDKTVDFITFNDLNTDAVIADNPLLYTTGGVLENIGPPAFGFIDIYKNRAILSGLEDEKTYAYSKTIIPGEGVSFTDTFVERVDMLGTGVVATKALDDKNILFKDNLIFAQVGDGPLDTGEQNSYSVPQLISSDVGCVEPDSIVLMPSGLMFKSNKGIYLLDRSLTVSYIGAPVESYNSQTIRSAELLESVSQVRFLCDSGRTLLYDYVFNKWNTFTNHTGYDAALWKGVYVYLRTNAVVYKESTTSFLDDTTPIVLNPTSAWIKASALQGFQRIWAAAILGNYFTAHTLTIKVYYDYNDTVFDTYSFNTATGIVGPDTVYQFRMHLKRQKCESIRFEFDDSVTATPGQGYSINDLALEIGLKRGVDKLPAIKSVG